MKKVFFSLTIVSVLFASCAKEQGCMDTAAVNYDALAEEDDASCTYEGEVVFWYSEATSAWLVDDNLSSSLYIYVDGELAGTYAADMYFTQVPDCESASTVGFTKSLGSQKSGAITYQVKDDWDDIIWTGTETLEANTCTTLELTL